MTDLEAHVNQPGRDKLVKAVREKINELGSENVAAFIGEPIQGAGGVIIPPDSYWPEIQRICQEHNILLIADEVICGFGRLGFWFGSESFKIKPDIMTIAKGLSSGYQPIGGSIISNKIAETLEQEGENYLVGVDWKADDFLALEVVYRSLRIQLINDALRTQGKDDIDVDALNRSLMQIKTDLGLFQSMKSSTSNAITVMKELRAQLDHVEDKLREALETAERLLE